MPTLAQQSCLAHGQITETDLMNAWQRIMSLDFSMLKMKAMSPEGLGWDKKTTDTAELLYRRFLFLKYKYGHTVGMHLVPTKMVDMFWHQHILDTRQYPKDCIYVFGFFLHHYPYFGLQGEQDAKDMHRAFTMTQELYRQEFSDDAFRDDLPAMCHCASCDATS